MSLTKGRGGKFDVSGTANESRSVLLTHPTMVMSHGLTEKIVFRDYSDRINANERWNNFEGTVEYNGKYYCIGESRFDSPTDAMNNMVVDTAWFSTKNLNWCFDPFPEFTWDSAQWASIPKPTP